MAEYDDREHFIPVRVSELIDFVCADTGPQNNQPVPDADQQAFRKLAQGIITHYHDAYLSELQILKDTYAWYDPDHDTTNLHEPESEARKQHGEQFFERVENLLSKANYTRLSRPEMEKIIEGASDWGLEMYVDWDIFDRLEVYYRGDDTIVRTTRKWYHLFRKREKPVDVFKRLVLVLKLNEERKGDADLDSASIFLKMFKDIPQMDMEMVLPGTRVRWSRLDKALVFYPVMTGLIVAGYSVIKQLISLPAKYDLLKMAGLGVLGTWALVVALGGYGYRSYYSYTVKKTNYTLQLTKSLYYQTMGSNAGVLFRLIDEAEEQECREAILAYFYLWRYAGESGWTEANLDDYIEMDLERRTKIKVDFEIHDALEKLERLGLAQKVGEHYRVPPVAEALTILAQVRAREVEEPPLASLTQATRPTTLDGAISTPS